MMRVKGMYPDKDFGGNIDWRWRTNPVAEFWEDLIEWIERNPNVQPAALVETMPEWTRRMPFNLNRDDDPGYLSRPMRMYYEERHADPTFRDPFNHNRYSGPRHIMDPTADDLNRFWFDCYLDTYPHLNDHDDTIGNRVRRRNQDRREVEIIEIDSSSDEDEEGDNDMPTLVDRPAL